MSGWAPITTKTPEFDFGSLQHSEEDQRAGGYFLVSRSFDDISFEEQVHRACVPPFQLDGHLTPLTAVVTAGGSKMEEYQYVLSENVLRPIDINIVRELIAATFTRPTKGCDLPHPLLFYCQDDGRGDVKYLGIEPRFVNPKLHNPNRRGSKSDIDKENVPAMPISSTISLREPSVAGTTPTLDALVRPRSSIPLG